MSDDILELATRALREQSAASEQDLAETRARLLMSSRSQTQRKANALRWVLPLAAAFFAGTALAATNGSLELAVRTVQGWVAASDEASTQAEKPRPAHKAKSERSVAAQVPAAREPEHAAISTPVEEPAPEPQNALAVLEQGAAAPPVAAEAKPERPRARAKIQRQAASPVQAPIAQPLPTPVPQGKREVEPAPQAQPSLDLALYRAAHRAHFKGGNASAALAQWDAYLAQFPGGMFALEAKYNRALCLVRLGRREEAAQALAPFAKGSLAGNYRRADAQALLEALK